jgi:pimeloyl-ACP methyl ester carboxylesterase
MRKIIPAVVLALGMIVAAMYLLFPGCIIEGLRQVLRWQAGLAKQGVQVDDHRWSYLEGGRGEVILFVHGYGMEKDAWNIFAKAWSDSHRLILPDLPGFGETTRLDSSVYDVPHQARRLDRFVNTLRIPSFHLVGISMGGAIAAYYAAAYPGKVRSLFLMAPAGVMSRVPSPAWREYQDKGKIVLLYENAEEFDALLDALFYRKPFVPGAVRRYFAERGAGEVRFREKILGDLAQSGIGILESRLGDVKAPTLVLWGENDRILHVSGAEKFQQSLPGCRIITLRECGHVVFFDQPEATRQAYRDFLQRLQESGAAT